MLSDDEFSRRAERIKLLLLDVDGVMTDGSIVVNDVGGETKRFYVRDGFAIRCWQRAGADTGVITGRYSRGVAYRCRELGIRWVIQSARDKLPAFRKMLSFTRVAPEEVCYLGDDLPDLPLVQTCGLGVAVADAAPELRSEADWVTESAGGHGAIRELIEKLLTANGQWPEIVDHYRNASAGFNVEG